MKKNFTLFKSLFLVLFLTIFGLLLNAQGTETFTNSNATSSYNNDSFVGDNGITWTYVASRDDNNTNAVTSKPALMLRRSSSNSSVESSSIPGGIGNISVKLYKGFTAKGNRQVELFVNGISKGLSEPFDDSLEHVFTLNDINVSGNVVIKILNKTGKQVIVDDITWTGYVSTTPTISALPQAVSLSAEVGATAPTQEITVSGTNLTADITSSLSGTDAGQFALSSQTLPQAGGTITVSYTPSATAATHTATLTLSSEGAADVVITLNGKTTEPLTITGEGTETNPYTVADVKLLKNSTGTTKYWVEGYIVGTPSKGNAGDLISADLEAPFTSTSAIVLAPTTTTTDLTEMIPVQLPSGSHRIALNLKDNPTNYQKKVRVYGTLELYYRASGVKNVSKHYIYPTTHIDNTTLQTLRVWTRDGNILLQAQAGEQIEVYNTTGQRIATTTSQEGINTITVSGKGLFIVRMGNSISKVVL